ncbi:hypothetical protein ARMSODRAFT_443324 [Armillaria solidipes]|uniref:Uncharacterized protein n=1 Tax=Armillaria solidipes TaxID=1076256 RepID=A0A2H3BKL0_9AGAR|nr:hypothetical protein ARMSODRAFT_443324 [Armillaria solidipes]
MNSLGADGNFDYGPSDAIAYPNIYQVLGDEAAALLTRCSLVCHSGPAASVERGCFGADIKYSTRTPPSLNFSSIVVPSVSLVVWPMPYILTFFLNTLRIDQWQLLPPSRGTVHISVRETVQLQTSSAGN